MGRPRRARDAVIFTDERVGEILEVIRVLHHDSNHWKAVRRGGGLRERHKRGDGQEIMLEMIIKGLDDEQAQQGFEGRISWTGEKYGE